MSTEIYKEYDKAIKVINSCETYGQVMTARRYAFLFRAKYKYTTKLGFEMSNNLIGRCQDKAEDLMNE